jgi:PilZ domain
MPGMRRSGRVAKEVPIVLLGTDATGRVFSEKTHTVVLSRHGAGILSRHVFAPEEVLSLRLPGSDREAEVRLVGRIGESSNGFVYGVEFLDPSVNYWEIEFPSPEDYCEVARGLSLECVLCHGRQIVQQSEVEADVFLATGSVFRFCERCGQTTPWRKSKPLPLAATADTALERQRVRSLTAPRDAESSKEARQTTENISVLSATAVLPASPAAASPSPGGPEFRGKKVNRRKHVRARVSFLACVRFAPVGEDFAQCENISKGGFCFRSKRRYPEGAIIEVAVPYEAGATAIFVSAQIKRVDSTEDGESFRYGASYLGSA